MSWTNPETVMVDDDKGLQLVYLHDLNDTKELGNLMSHCSGQHEFMVKAGLWHFWTVLDKAGVPHISVHARNVTCPDDEILAKLYDDLGFKRSEVKYSYGAGGYDNYTACYSTHQPDKKYFQMYDYLSTLPTWARDLVDNPEAPPAPEKGTAEFYTWRSSWPKTEGAKPFIWRDQPCVMLSSYVRGQYSNTTPDSPYDTLVRKFFESRVIKDEPAIPLKYSY